MGYDLSALLNPQMPDELKTFFETPSLKKGE